MERTLQKAVPCREISHSLWECCVTNERWLPKTVCFMMGRSYAWLDVQKKGQKWESTMSPSPASLCRVTGTIHHQLSGCGSAAIRASSGSMSIHSKMSAFALFYWKIPSASSTSHYSKKLSSLLSTKQPLFFLCTASL